MQRAEDHPIARLALAQRRLGGLARADVARGEDEAAHRRIGQQVGRHRLEGSPRSVAVAQPQLDRWDGVRGFQAGGEVVAHPRAVVGVDHGEDGAARRHVGGVSEQARDGGAAVEDRTHGVGDGHQIGGVLRQGAEARLAAGQRRRVASLRGHVGEGDHNRVRAGFARRDQRLGGDDEPDQGAVGLVDTHRHAHLRLPGGERDHRRVLRAEKGCAVLVYRPPAWVEGGTLGELVGGQAEDTFRARVAGDDAPVRGLHHHAIAQRSDERTIARVALPERLCGALLGGDIHPQAQDPDDRASRIPQRRVLRLVDRAVDLHGRSRTRVGQGAAHAIQDGRLVVVNVEDGPPDNRARRAPKRD